MSVPLTPEQRETLDELVLSMIAALNHEQINYGGRFSTVTVDGSDLAALRAALVALDGADDRLRAAQEATCATCRHFWPWDRTAMAGTGDCHHHKFHGRMNGLADTFGCRAWATRKDERDER